MDPKQSVKQNMEPEQTVDPEQTWIKFCDPENWIKFCDPENWIKFCDPENWIKFCDPKAEYFEFSNFYKHKKPIVIDGEEYKTTEHYFQSQKYADDIGKNLEFMKLIKDQNTPGQAKMLANPIKRARWVWETKLKELREKYEDDIHFDHVKWDAIRISVMYKALFAKFSQDDHCKKLLLSTGHAILCEDRKRDPFWGSGGTKQIGKLGELLMQVRSSLKTELITTN